MSKPRQHHFVQAAHLRNFADENGRLYIYSKSGEQFETTAEGIFKQRDLNSFNAEDGLSVEFEAIITQVEQDLFPAVQRTIDSEVLDQNNLQDIIAYIALSRMRNPAFQKVVVDVHKSSAEIVAKIADARGSFNEIGENPIYPGKSITEMLDDGDIQLEINNSVFVSRVLEMAEQSRLILSKGFRWGLVYSDLGRLVISDHPVTYLHPGQDFAAYGMPFGGRTCEVGFPLSPRLSMIGQWQREPGCFASEDAVDELNDRQAMFANRHIAAQTRRPRWRAIAAKHKNWGFTHQLDVLPAEDGTTQVVRSKVLPFGQARRRGFVDPARKSKPISSFTKRPVL